MYCLFLLSKTFLGLFYFVACLHIFKYKQVLRKAVKMRNNITKHFSSKIKSAFELLTKSDFDDIQEIRLRVQKPLCITKSCKNVFVTQNGGLTAYQSCSLICEQSDIEFTLKSVCDHSIYSYHRELSQCFVTVSGGHRVGISGTAVYDNNRICGIPKYVSSLNFRIASQKIGCADEIYNNVLKRRLKSLLIVGKPMSAKTTILRDLSRLYGNLFKVSLIDERSEIASCFNGVPYNDVGVNTDVFDRFSKSDGIIFALRAMSPQMIICDEIGSDDDAIALIDAHKSGINIIATAHAGTVAQALSRKSINMLVNSDVFDYAILLGNDENIGKIIDIVRFGEENEAVWNYYDNDIKRTVGISGGKTIIG